jgi:hypothetical protein
VKYIDPSGHGFFEEDGWDFGTGLSGNDGLWWDDGKDEPQGPGAEHFKEVRSEWQEYKEHQEIWEQLGVDFATYKSASRSVRELTIKVFLTAATAPDTKMCFNWRSESKAATIWSWGVGGGIGPVYKATGGDWVLDWNNRELGYFSWSSINGLSYSTGSWGVSPQIMFAWGMNSLDDYQGNFNVVSQSGKSVVGTVFASQDWKVKGFGLGDSLGSSVPAGTAYRAHYELQGRWKLTGLEMEWASHFFPCFPAP